MTYTEKELDQFLHGISLSLLSKKSAQHWRYDEETAKEIEWLEVLERKVRADKADRKTEPTSSKMEQVDKDINVRSKTEPKRGEWVDMGDFEQCSVCKGTRLKEFQSYYGKTTWVKTPYCPNCGADMRGREGE